MDPPILLPLLFFLASFYKHNHKHLNIHAHSVTLTQTTSVHVRTFVDRGCTLWPWPVTLSARANPSVSLSREVKHRLQANLKLYERITHMAIKYREKMVEHFPLMAVELHKTKQFFCLTKMIMFWDTCFKLYSHAKGICHNLSCYEWAANCSLQSCLMFLSHAAHSFRKQSTWGHTTLQKIFNKISVNFWTVHTSV